MLQAIKKDESLESPNNEDTKTKCNSFCWLEPKS